MMIERGLVAMAKVGEAEMVSKEEEKYMCVTCGVQYPSSSHPPQTCLICTEERQFVPKSGQSWTTLEKMKQQGFKNGFKKYEHNLYGLGTFPSFGIGQRAFLICTTEGNLLWDCISYLDGATIDIIKALGGLRAIAISHPHYYSTICEWSASFGDIPVYIHDRDQKWVVSNNDKVQFWNGKSLNLWGDLTLLHLGGHFAGAQILHWESGADGKGALFTGDILQVCKDQYISIMRSYPNFIPLSASHAMRIKGLLEPWSFDRVYGAFWDLQIESDGKERVNYSLERYVRYLSSDDVML